MSEQKCYCSDALHEEKHLCSISMKKDFDMLKKLIVNAHYYCKNCGRSSHSKENLCNPEEL